MIRATRLLPAAAAAFAMIATALFSASPAEARHWRHGYYGHGFYGAGVYRAAVFPALYPRPVVYPRPIVYPRPVVYVPPPPPVFVPRPVVFAPPPPPPPYAYSYRSGYRYAARPKHRHVKKVSKKRSCICKPAAAPAPATGS